MLGESIVDLFLDYMRVIFEEQLSNTLGNVRHLKQTIDQLEKLRAKDRNQLIESQQAIEAIQASTKTGKKVTKK